VRDSAAWRSRLMRDLGTAGFPEEIMPRPAFCQVELGLYFLARHFPGEPIGVLQPALSGYVRTSDDLGPVIRRVRHRMGDVARRGYWRTLLNQYMRVPDSIRAFDRTDDPARRVNDQTVFRAYPSSVCPDRDDVYAAALTDPLGYAAVTECPPAEAGRRYTFLASGVPQVVQLPDQIPSAEPVEALCPASGRRREPWTISFGRDLKSAAAWIDTRLEKRPDITNRDFSKRLGDIRFAGVDPDAPDLVDRPDEFTLDGVAHIVGLMNSGKTTLADLITIHRVRDHGNRVCLVVSSVADVYGKVSFLRSLGIDAVPLIGHSSRSEHASRYWRTRIEEAADLVPDEYTPADPAAAYANASCLLEPFRRSTAPGWAPLRPEEFPCRTSLMEADNDESPAYDCPLLPVCPAQKAFRETAAARVWITTPQCLVDSKARPATASMRWFEQVQHDMDLIIFDEADAVQQVFDRKFVQTEELVAPVKGWSHRMAGHTNDAMAGLSMAPVVNPDVQKWHEFLQIHQKAVFMLNQLALSAEGEQLKKLLGGATFTAHSLLRHAARMLYGLPVTGEGDKDTEDAAENFYQQHLQDFAEQPLQTAGHSLEAAVTEMTRFQRDDAAIQRALDTWITQNASPALAPEQLDHERAMLRLVIEAAVCAGRIITTFFEMSSLYPSVHEILKLPDDERFWLSQPPRDYRPLIPEAPMGNLLALRWAANRNGGAALQLLWVHGIGRWLLHHAHDLLSPEGVDGPHVILTSATSWAPGSSFYHIPIFPTAVLRQPDEDRDALMTSTMAVQPGRTADDTAIFVSGRDRSTRDDSLRQMVTWLCELGNGRRRSLVDDLRAQLPPDRQQLLFVVLSGQDAQVVGDHVNNRTRYTARNVVPDAADPGKDGILRRLVGGFGHTGHDILVAAEMSIQRGYNILNSNDTAALGAVIYLSRSHPPPFDLGFPLSLVSQLAIEHLQHPLLAAPGEAAALTQELHSDARATWFGAIGRPVQFRTLHERYRPAFVANNLVPMSQTIGRSIRGNQPTTVLLCDGAFAERLATRDPAPDTQRTSLVVATDALLTRLLTPPSSQAGAAERRLHAINEAVWGLMGHLITTNNPLGSRRTTTSGHQ
jgi:hypothetical protein